MAHPIGQPSYQDESGDWVGMTPQGVQRVIGESYMNEGILPGGGAAKVGGTSGWNYVVPAMAVFARTASSAERRGVLIPIEQTTLPVSAPAGGAKRTDTIYVEPDEGIVRVREGASTAPGVIIDRVVIPASATNTQGISSNYDTVYAVPAGASLGRYAHWAAPAGDESTMSQRQRYSGRFVTPTDRLARLDVCTTIRSITTTGGNIRLIVVIDGSWRRTAWIPHTTQWSTTSASWSANLSAGPHTIEVFTEGVSGDLWELSHSESETSVSLWDMGVAE